MTLYKGKEQIVISELTKSKYPLVRNSLATPYHVSDMGFRHLVVADVKPFHVFLFECSENVADF